MKKADFNQTIDISNFKYPHCPKCLDTNTKFVQLKDENFYFICRNCDNEFVMDIEWVINTVVLDNYKYLYQCPDYNSSNLTELMTMYITFNIELKYLAKKWYLKYNDTVYKKSDVKDSHRESNYSYREIRKNSRHISISDDSSSFISDVLSICTGGASRILGW